MIPSATQPRSPAGDPSPRDGTFLRFTDGDALVHQPALDGVRGFALAAVVLLHLQPNLVPGGAGGVSLFFTLSGFLITTMILHGSRRHGRVALEQFWSSRARRLMPAALLVLAVVSILRVATNGYAATKRPDAPMAALQVLNWFQVVRENTGGYSALGHMWSLSVEEQLYVVIAMSMVLAVRLRASLRSIALVAIGASVVSFLIPVVADLASLRVYAGTDTRAGEFFAGVALATIAFTADDRRWLLRHRVWISALGLGGFVGLAGLFLRTSHFAYGADRVLFPLMALFSVCLILGALVPGGPLHAALCAPAITWLGRRSYAIYLYHIPVAVGVDHWLPSRTALGRAALVLAIALPLAELSHRALESPVRARRLTGRPLVAMAGLAAVVIVGCSFVG